MKNIAIIVPTLNKGGAERVAANMSLEFAKYYNVYVIVHDGRNIIYPYGGTLIDLELPPSESKLGKVTTLLKRIAKLREIKKKYRIDVSISHLPPSNYANIFSKVGDSVFTYVHSMKCDPHREKFVSLFSDKMICVSRCAGQNLVRNCGISPEKVVAVYNFCDLEPPEMKMRDSDVFTVVNMGRLSEPKGQWHLLRAMKLVNERLEKKVNLKLVGDGELRAELERLAEELGIQEQVSFTGFLDDPWKEIAGADLYVCASLWEGLPMALIEAGRCGLPIISTDCDAGCREILAPNTPVDLKTDKMELAEYGVIVPVCSEEPEDQLIPTDEECCMADAIIQMLSSEELRITYAQKAKQRSEDFRAGCIMGQWRELIGT